jgi:hypothetical protein
MQAPTRETIQQACAFPDKGARAYARVQLRSGLELAFIRTNGRRNEPLEAWYVTNDAGTLRIQDAQVSELLTLWTEGEISTQRIDAVRAK